MTLGDIIFELVDPIFTGYERWKCRTFGHRFISEGQLGPELELLKQKELNDRMDSGMSEDERGRPYTTKEAQVVADNYPDEYVREMVQFLLRRIERLSVRS